MSDTPENCTHESETPENCSHDCSSCGENCPSRNPNSFLKKLHEGVRVGKVIAIVSGKGGVGKSFVTSILASEMQRRGHTAAVLDADVTGPSIPQMFGVHEHATGRDNAILPVYSARGVQMMSMNILLENETDPVVWRGPIIAGAVEQFWTDVLWEDVDYMFVDMPPGTGDVPLTVFQSLPVNGVVVVTSPQELVGMIVEKAANMAAMMNKKVIGIVENMSYFECPGCGKKSQIFGNSHIEEVAERFGIEHIVKLPIDPLYATACDAGEVESLTPEAIKDLCDFIENGDF